MSAGAPDWYLTGLSDDVAASYDTYELATRLGSNVNYDRTGKVWWNDNFDWYDTRWTSSGVGIGTVPTLYQLTREYGSNCLRTVLNVGATNFVTLTRQIKTPGNVLLSAEIGFHVNLIPDLIHLELYNDVNRVRQKIGMRITDSGLVISYLNEGGSYQSVGTFFVTPLGENFYSVMKLSAYFDTKTYKEVSVNNKLMPVTTPSLYPPASTQVDHIGLNITCYGNAGGALALNLDRVIVSQDL